MILIKKNGKCLRHDIFFMLQGQFQKISGIVLFINLPFLGF